MFNDIAFMNDFISYTTLSDADCRILIDQYRQGNLNALELLIKGFSKMIISFIPYHQRNSENSADLYQNGVIGIIKAANEFNLKSEIKFSTYVFVAIKRWMAKNNHLIEMPSSLWKASKEYETLITNHSKNIKDEFLCDQLNVSLEELYLIKNAFNTLYIENIEDISECKMNSVSDDISEYVVTKIDTELLYTEIEHLKDKRQIEFVKLHLGMIGEPYTFQEIGNLYGISKQRVQVIFKKALLILKEQKNMIELAKEYL